MSTLIEFGQSVVKAASLEKKFDIDSVDRLKYRYTNWMIIGASVFIFGKNYVGESVNCWANNEILGAWEEYIETYCLIENTYFVPMNDSNLPVQGQRQTHEMVYYQWVPFILLGMSLFLYLPRYLWTSMQKRLGLDLPSITDNLRKSASKLGDEGVEKFRLQLPEMADKYGDRFGKRLASALLITKVLSIVVIVSELVLLNTVLGSEYHFWGFGVLMDLLNGREWHTSGHFPRVTFCDVEVRQMGGIIQNWTFQCVLHVNMFNEKIFIFLWWWMMFLLVVSLSNLLSWIVRVTNGDGNIGFVKEILSYNDVSDSDNDKNMVTEFVHDVLKSDGCLVLRLIAENATTFKAAEYVKPFWDKYRRTHSPSISDDMPKPKLVESEL
ncbi:unnamed protein product, partial [Mesorhabditis spiculigera]